MTVQFEALTQALARDDAARTRLSGPHRRLADAWFSDAPGDTIAGDVGALVAHVLRHERYAGASATPALRLPVTARGVDPAVLALSNLTCAHYGGHDHAVSLAQRWEPGWLHGDPRWIDVACAAPGCYDAGNGQAVSTYARPDTPVPVDPALTALAPGITKYRSRTQATAVRTAVLGDPAATLHVVLPTGTGKSIVGLAPALLRPHGVTVVVVPTIALALDQERTLHARFPGAHLPAELAYYGDRDAAEKQAIRDRLREGTQPALFTSPEALLTGLASALRMAAEAGRLTSMIIDEAHLIRLWGLEFRRDFQLLGSLVDELRAIAAAGGHEPPRVILLTATLSQEGLELNETLFAAQGPSTFIGSAFLRTELRYLHGRSDSPDERVDRVVEALRHLPRPAIVYVARQRDAEQITERLHSAGMTRAAYFHGDVLGNARLEILDGWFGAAGPTTYDVVVGTSAFGLGVDQSDVRTVVHACAPAFLDRFYQEVGRAGRDGHAAVSLWLTAPGDVQVGRTIESSALIGDQKAWNRWHRMRRSATVAESDPALLVLDTGVVPTHGDRPSDKNRLWNRNTLTLMERAGLLTGESTPPPDVRRQDGESDAAFERRRTEAWQCFTDEARVRLNPRLSLDEATFEQQLGALRRNIRATERASQARIEALLARDRCWAEVIAEEYRFTDVGRMRATMSITPACSGCPATGHQQRPGYDAPLPLVQDVELPDLHRHPSPALAKLAGGGNVVIVSYSGSVALTLQNLVQRLVGHGVRAILAAPRFASLGAVTGSARYAEEGFVMVDEIGAEAPHTSFAAPALVLLDDTLRPLVSWLAPSRGPLRVVVVPEDMPDPEKPTSRLVDYRTPHWRLAEFTSRI